MEENNREIQQLRQYIRDHHGQYDKQRFSDRWQELHQLCKDVVRRYLDNHSEEEQKLDVSVQQLTFHSFIQKFTHSQHSHQNNRRNQNYEDSILSCSSWLPNQSSHLCMFKRNQVSHPTRSNNGYTGFQMVLMTSELLSIRTLEDNRS